MAEETFGNSNQKISYSQVDQEKVQKLVATFDPELRFRKQTGVAAKVTLAMCLILSIFHIYTAGFGVLQEWEHRAFRLSFVLALIFGK